MGDVRRMPNLLTTKQVATILETTPRQIARKVARGELTPIQQLPGVRGAFLFDGDAPELQNVQAPA